MKKESILKSKNTTSPVISLTRGDRKSQVIAAASIIAKVTRDRLMVRYHERFPRYNFASNKGYGTKEHRKAIDEFGPCKIHRLTFHGVTRQSIF